MKRILSLTLALCIVAMCCALPVQQETLQSVDADLPVLVVEQPAEYQRVARSPHYGGYGGYPGGGYGGYGGYPGGGYGGYPGGGYGGGYPGGFGGGYGGASASASAQASSYGGGYYG